MNNYELVHKVRHSDDSHHPQLGVFLLVGEMLALWCPLQRCRWREWNARGRGVPGACSRMASWATAVHCKLCHTSKFLTFHVFNNKKLTPLSPAPQKSLTIVLNRPIPTIPAHLSIKSTCVSHLAWFKTWYLIPVIQSLGMWGIVGVLSGPWRELKNSSRKITKLFALPFSRTSFNINDSQIVVIQLFVKAAHSPSSLSSREILSRYHFPGCNVGESTVFQSLNL